jgi:hypothetical protein
VFTPGFGKSKEKEGDQHQREAVCTNDAADLGREVGWITKRTG